MSSDAQGHPQSLPDRCQLLTQRWRPALYPESRVAMAGAGTWAMVSHEYPSLSAPSSPGSRARVKGQCRAWVWGFLLSEVTLTWGQSKNTTERAYVLHKAVPDSTLSIL